MIMMTINLTGTRGARGVRPLTVKSLVVANNCFTSEVLPVPEAAVIINNEPVIRYFLMKCFLMESVLMEFALMQSALIKCVLAKSRLVKICTAKRPKTVLVNG